MFTLSSHSGATRGWRRAPGLIAAGAVLLVGASGVLRMGMAHGAEPARVVPAPVADEPASAGQEVAVLSGGCFWGVQGVFQRVQGVSKVLAGYAGGTQAQASYETVSSGLTNHAEYVQITFDPKQISYGQILRVFFSVALDPTQRGGQGPDTGPQYRSEVFYTSETRSAWWRRSILRSSTRRMSSARRSRRGWTRCRPSIRQRGITRTTCCITRTACTS